jgi:hypothetical protein
MVALVPSAVVNQRGLASPLAVVLLQLLFLHSAKAKRENELAFST